MLCLYDSRAGQAAAVRPGRGRELLIWTWASVHSRPSAGDLRRLLVADLVRRTVQMHRLDATSRWAPGPRQVGRAGAAGPVTEPTAEAGERALLADCAELNIHPPQYPPGAPASLGRAPDVAVAGGGQAPIPDPEQGDGIEVMAGPVRTDADAAGSSAAGSSAAASSAAGSSAALPWVAGLGVDPLALRLALLRCPYREPATLTAEALAQADADLRAWRWQVAGWATQPSEPISAAYRARVYAAFDDDLDVPAALAVLAELAADDGVAQGARFETFAHLDQLLGLDLAREVGHAPPAGH